MMKYLIDRRNLSYDSMVADEAWLIPIEDGDGTDDEETERLRTDKVQGEDITL